MQRPLVATVWDTKLMPAPLCGLGGTPKPGLHSGMQSHHTAKRGLHCCTHRQFISMIPFTPLPPRSVKIAFMIASCKVTSPGKLSTCNVSISLLIPLSFSPSSPFLSHALDSVSTYNTDSSSRLAIVWLEGESAELLVFSQASPQSPVWKINSYCWKLPKPSRQRLEYF